MNGRYALDKGNAKLMGVCAGLSRWTGSDATLVRIATVVAALCLPVTILVYLAAGFVAPAARH